MPIGIENSITSSGAVEFGDEGDFVPRGNGAGNGEAVVPTEQQQAFPAFWPLIRPLSSNPFAHPAERDFSTILDFYRVRWAYEPTSFPLEWDDSGRPCELFTPDFYLPDQRMYVELTTMRQRLVTRKNRKLRRLRELYPEISIKLLYRRDYFQLQDLYSVDPPHASAQPGKLLFDETTIALRIEELAAEIVTRCDRAIEGVPLFLVSSAGATRFADELACALARNRYVSEWDRIEMIASQPLSSSGKMRVVKRPVQSILGRRIIVVTDVVSSGLRMAHLSRWLMREGAVVDGICTLIDRPHLRLARVPLRHIAFQISNDLVVGHGLCLKPSLAHLAGISTLAPSARDEPEVAISRHAMTEGSGTIRI